MINNWFFLFCGGNLKFNNYFNRLAILVAVFSGLYQGCAKKTEDKVLVKDCVLPDDQKATLSGRWSATPIPLALNVSQLGFSAQEVATIAKSADTWNHFTLSSQGLQIVNYGSQDSPNVSGASKPLAICTQSIIEGEKFTGSVLIIKQGAWPYPNHNAIALTSFCTRAATGSLSEIYIAILELNYQDFFVAGKKAPDLQSIVLHEMGHVIGLDHSCDLRQKAGFPDCRSNDLPPSYLNAAMFPSFGFDDSGHGEQRQALNENDQGRANCLYKDLKK